MKKLILLTSLLFLPSFISVKAENADIATQIEQLQIEIKERQASIRELRNSQNDSDTVEFEHEGLKFLMQIESVPYEGDQTNFEDTYIILHLSVENTTDTAMAFDPDGFNMYLADVQQGGVYVFDESMDRQAIPGNTTVEGKTHFNITKDVSNDKDLIIRYEPSDTIFVGDTVFEFKVNDYKFISSDTETVMDEEEEVSITPLEEPADSIAYYEEPSNYEEPINYPNNIDEGTYEVIGEDIFYQIDGVQYIETDVYKGPFINPQGPPVPFNELTE